MRPVKKSIGHRYVGWVVKTKTGFIGFCEKARRFPDGQIMLRVSNIFDAQWFPESEITEILT